MKYKLFFATIIFFTVGFISTAQTKKIEADKKESFITYKLTHPLHEVEATSKDAYCIIEADIQNKEIKSVFVQVDVTSFDSGNSNRDSHAMEVIDALSYPVSTFQSSSISQNGDNLIVSGKLTFHGITKEIMIPVNLTWSKDKLVVDGGFDISLTEFHVERPSLLMIPVKDNLEFTLSQSFNLE